MLMYSSTKAAVVKYWVFCTAISVLCILYYVHCTVYIVHSTMILCTTFSDLCTILFFYLLYLYLLVQTVSFPGVIVLILVIISQVRRLFQNRVSGFAFCSVVRYEITHLDIYFHYKGSVKITFYAHFRKALDPSPPRVLRTYIKK